MAGPALGIAGCLMRTVPSFDKDSCPLCKWKQLTDCPLNCLWFSEVLISPLKKKKPTTWSLRCQGQTSKRGPVGVIELYVFMLFPTQSLGHFL